MTDEQCINTHKTWTLLQALLVSLFLYGFQFSDIFWLCYVLFFILQKAFFYPPKTTGVILHPYLPITAISTTTTFLCPQARSPLWRGVTSSKNKNFLKAHMILIKTRNLSINILPLLKLTKNINFSMRASF